MSEPIFDPRCLRLWALLRQGHIGRARELVEHAVAEHSAEWAYLHVLIPVAYLITEGSRRDDRPAALANALLEEARGLMNVARAGLSRRPRLGKKLFASYLPGDTASLGLRAIADWLDRDGWDVTLPFPPPPPGEIVSAVLALRPDAVAFSCGLPKSIALARRIIRALKGGGLRAPIWLGGMPVNALPDLFARTGADRTARDILTLTREMAAEYGYETATPPELPDPAGHG